MAFTPVVTRDGNNTAQNFAAFQDASSINYSAVNLDSQRPTYRAAANFTPQPTGAVTLISIQGSATKTIRIKRIGIGGVGTGSVQQIFGLFRSTALGAGGTTVTPTVAQLDTTAAAATAVVQHYTTTLKAAGTGGTVPLSMGNVQLTVTAVPITSPGVLQPLFPEFGAPVGQAIVLRGVAQFLEVQNVLAANLGAGTVLCYMVEWEEDNS